MAPILIDRRGIIKYSVLLSLTMLMLFSSGFFLGYHKAETRLSILAETHALDLPDTVIPDVASLEPEVPDELAPGADIDVDAPDDESQQLAVNAVETAIPTQQEAIDNPVATESQTEAAQPSQQETITPPAVTEVQTQRVSVGGPVEPVVDEPIALMMDNTDEDSASYSIQVGLFRDIENAERKVEDLLAQQLTAYSTETTNKKQEPRYNVRFGYYSSYRTALQALNTYKTALSGDGYLIRLKKKNL